MTIQALGWRGDPRRAKPALEDMSDRFRRARADPADRVRLRGEVELADVHFSYRDLRHQAIAGISLRIAPGETVALVGPLNHLTPTFTSSPALPEMDIVSLLFVGRTAEQASQSQTGAVASSSPRVTVWMPPIKSASVGLSIRFSKNTMPGQKKKALSELEARMKEVMMELGLEIE